jgi:hypothetical protein
VPSTSRKQNFQMYNVQWQQQDANKSQVLTRHCTPLSTPQTAVSGGFALNSRTLQCIIHGSFLRSLKGSWQNKVASWV